jgi:cytochrome c oxidase subunit IV
MIIQQRILKFVLMSNWILVAATSLAGVLFWSAPAALGILFGGLIVTVNFHLLYRTLKKAFRPPHIAPVNLVLAKYYLRFILSGVIIFLLIYTHLVNPLGLFVGLSVVVASIMLATACEVKKLICKEAV